MDSSSLRWRLSCGWLWDLVGSGKFKLGLSQYWLYWWHNYDYSDRIEWRHRLLIQGSSNQQLWHKWFQFWNFGTYSRVYDNTFSFCPTSDQLLNWLDCSHFWNSNLHNESLPFVVDFRLVLFELLFNWLVIRMESSSRRINLIEWWKHQFIRQFFCWNLYLHSNRENDKWSLWKQQFYILANDVSAHCSWSADKLGRSHCKHNFVISNVLLDSPS